MKKQFNADYALTSQNGFTPTDISSVAAVRKLPQVTTAAGVRAGRGKEFGKQFDVTPSIPGISQVLTAPWKDGSQRRSRRLGAHGRGRERLDSRRSTTSSSARRSTC